MMSEGVEREGKGWDGRLEPGYVHTGRGRKTCAEQRRGHLREGASQLDAAPYMAIHPNAGSRDGRTTCLRGRPKKRTLHAGRSGTYNARCIMECRWLAEAPDGDVARAQAGRQRQAGQLLVSVRLYIRGTVHLPARLPACLVCLPVQLGTSALPHSGQWANQHTHPDTHTHDDHHHHHCICTCTQARSPGLLRPGQANPSHARCCTSRGNTNVVAPLTAIGA